ncbi:MAG: hypothetical protein RL385_164 [Pseudomonadota bacterium]
MAASSTAREPHCHLRTIARGGTAKVQHCAHCGALSVHLGPVTLRFDVNAMQSLHRTLGDALRVVCDESSTSQPIAPSVRVGARGSA